MVEDFTSYLVFTETAARGHPRASFNNHNYNSNLSVSAVWLQKG